MTDVWQSAMDHAVAVARKAGQKMVRDAVGSVQKEAVMVKSSSIDLVTQTDQKVEKLIIQSVKEKFPTHCFIGEESVAAGEACVLTDAPTWIIDPIDGTTNFVHTFPFVAVSIGFSVNKQVEFGVVYSCFQDQMYTARRGRGAFCNGEPLQVSQQQDIQQAIIATEFGSNRDPQTVDKIFSSLKRVVSIPVHGPCPVDDDDDDDDDGARSRVVAGCAAQEAQPSTCAWWRPAAWRRTTRSASTCGTSPPGRSSSPRPAAS
ncbi:inositol monophosphatase 1-like isoform X3 [Phyllopteryx taeniolatus]|uniref:inositol monophosphatase 1-like isoform X3 n=1 Tax=Phyllopteryx taeniolatus TaxID=161469 RepID=UPI002AD4C362|nr:inositol monophosphatase 1-like isoform X3 [Phyllopteryx taeniolatus]